MDMRFDGRVAIVTGAGAGLGRAHALALAARGARVVVNDLGVARDGRRAGSQAARAVVEEIRAQGGDALANGGDVTERAEMEAMVAETVEAFGRVDILVNNAGFLRDKTFAKMDLDDFEAIIDVHLMGAVNATKAVWPRMIDQGYGRIVMTTSATGLYGNFGQSNYGAAKAGVVGLMRTLAQEGARHGIRVNTLAPSATTRMTEALLPEEVLALLAPETITPGLLMLVDEAAPSAMVLCAGGGVFAEAKLVETRGVALTGDALSPEGVRAALAAIRDPEGAAELKDAFSQTRKIARMAAAERGLPMPWEEA